jgi:hypothetical protein
VPTGAAALRRRLRSRQQKLSRRFRCFQYEALLDTGGKQSFTLKLYDAKGNFIRIGTRERGAVDARSARRTVGA